MNTESQYPKIYLYRRIVQAKLFIDSHFEEAIDLDNISGEAALSKFHFIRLFAKTYGRTPHQYLTEVRIQKAKELLKEKIAVEQVCFAVGFSSVSSFTGLFKKRTGQTPSFYQLSQLQLKKEIKAAPLRFVPGCFAEMRGWKQNSFAGAELIEGPANLNISQNSNFEEVKA